MSTSSGVEVTEVLASLFLIESRLISEVADIAPALLGLARADSGAEAFLIRTSALPKACPGGFVGSASSYLCRARNALL